MEGETMEGEHLLRAPRVPSQAPQAPRARDDEAGASQAPSHPAPARFYRPELDVLRFIAFMFVFWAHRNDLAPIRKAEHPWLNGLTQIGVYGVPVFFLLSAFPRLTTSMKTPAPSLLRLAACFILPVLLLCTQAATAQGLPGKRDALHSSVLKEERVIQVLLPEGYTPGSDKRYDVLYLLDGDTNLKSVSAIQRFSQDESQLPPMIMVAVFNTNRDRDFLPTAMTPNGTAGAANFLAFFKNELIPYVDKTYPTSGNNLLFGHSFGGVFAMYALLTEPQLFNAYLAIDPSFWWDGGIMNKLAAGKLGVAAPGKSLFIAGREGEGLRQMGITDMDAVLKDKAPPDLAWKVAAYPDESHGSVRLKGVYDGLRFFYEGYSDRAVEFHPMNGLVLKDQPYKIYYLGPSESVHYTTDGSPPTAASPKMPRQFTLTNTVQVTARQVGRNDRNNRTTVGRFQVAKPLPAGARPANVTPGGWRYAYYEGEWDALPDFSTLKPVRTGVADKDFDLGKLPRQVNFGCVIEGFIEIQAAGHYVFALDSDDGSKLFLGDRLLIAYDGLHGGGNVQSYVVPLEKGFYPIRIEYFQKGGGAFLNLRYVTPDDPTERVVSVPFERQYGSR